MNMQDTNIAPAPTDSARSALSAQRRCILVLGMHRSGTSALTRVLSLFGAELPKRLVGAHKTNPTGHWEPEKIMRANNRLLTEAGSRWDDWRPFDPDALPAGCYKRRVREIRSLIEQEYEDSPLFVLKEPRISRLVPLYREVLENLGVQPLYLVANRNPLGVIASLASRNHFSETFSSLLWLRHVLEAEAATRGRPRAFLSYEQLLDDWRTPLTRVSDTLGLQWPRSFDDAAAEIEAHLSRDYQHHAPSIADLLASPDIPGLVKQAFLALQGLEDDPHGADAVAELGRIKTEMDESGRLFGAAFFPEMKAREKRAAAQLKQFSAREAALKKEIEVLTAAYAAEMKASTERAAELEGLRERAQEKLQITLEAREHELAQALQRMEASRKEADTLKASEARLRQLHRSVIAQNDALRGSTSWRMTRPIRGMKRALTEKGFTRLLLNYYLSKAKNLRRRTARPIGTESGRVKKNTNEAPVISRVKGDLAARPGKHTVLVFAHSVSRVIFGGERSFIDVVEALSSSGLNVFTVLPHDTPHYTEAIRKICHGVYFQGLPWWNSKEESAASVESIGNIIRDAGASAVYINTIVLREPAVAARRLNIPVITHAREIVSDDPWISADIGLSPEAIIHDVQERSDSIVCNSVATVKGFEGGPPTILARNAFETRKFLALKDRGGGKFTVGLIGSLGEKKGVADFAAVARKLAKSHPNVRLLLVGPKSQYVAHLMQKQDWPSNVELTGYIPDPVKAVEQLDVVLNLSLFAESFGRTVLEAMAAAKPVIAYDHGALGELVQNSVTGFLVPFRDVDAVCSRIAQLAADPELRRTLGEAARKAVGFGFGVERLASDLSLAVEQLLDKTPEPGPHRRKAPARELDILKARHLASLTGNKPSGTSMRIAYFLWHFPVPSETFVLNELRLLVEIGHDVIVFCKESPHPDFKLDFDIRFERVNNPNELAARLADTGRQVVHAHFVYPTVTNMVWPACDSVKIPFTFIAHSQDIFRYDNAAVNRIEELSQSHMCLRVFVPSRFHLDYLEQAGVPAAKIQINPNGIDSASYTARHLRERLKGKRLCAVHRFTEKKGLIQLVRAMKLVADPDVTLQLYGYGPDQDFLQQEIENVGLTNVSIRGAVPSREELLDVFASHDLFLCPSLRARNGDMDGIPTVLMEAMAAGLPVVTTSAAGIPELVIDGLTGLVCESEPASIAAAVDRFLRMSEREIRGIVSSSRRHVEENYDVKDLTRNLMDVWRGVRIDIVIVSWNNLKELEEVVGRIFRFTRSPFHLIICDNMSGSDVREYLRGLHARETNVTVVFNDQNAMVGPGTNLAVAHGDSEFVFYVCGKEGFAFQHGWETEALRILRSDSAVGLVGTRCYSPSYLTAGDYPEKHPFFSEFRNQHFASEHPDRIMSHVQGGLFAFRRTAFDDIGGFSERVAHNGTDVEFSYVAESKGWRIATLHQVLSIYHKTKPDIWSRLDDNLRAVHPPRLEDLPRIERVLASRGGYCNVCGFDSDAEGHVEVAAFCTNCGASPADRSLWKHLAESTLTHRRLAALSIGDLGALEAIWKQQFQGPQLSEQDFAGRLEGKGQMPNRAGGLSLVLYRGDISRCYSQPHWVNWIAEANRLLPVGGTLLIQPRFLDISDELRADEEILPQERDALADNLLTEYGFSAIRRVRHHSRSTSYSWWPIVEAAKAVDRNS
jgi:glycosyltransferase involved in cell wall biosynthesis/GT2 family glycosyltransferase